MPVSSGFAHLVGSVNLPDAESTFTTVSDHLGGRLHRIPDGEVGDRYYWMQFQKDYFDETAGLERVGDSPILIRGRFDARPFRLDGTVDAADLQLPGLGYADAAIDSYAKFTGLKAAGVVAASTRFQVSLPTPAGVVFSSFVAEDRAAIEPVYERALFRELDRILEAVPHDQLAIQWDTALEFGMLERAEIRGRAVEAWFGHEHADVLAGVLERAAVQGAVVPADVEVGYHLCYGDVEEHHFVQPADAGMLAEFLSGLFAAAPRTITWVHLPVPIERDDDAYFAPLASVAWPATTEVYLGLLHHEDGIEGALRRSATASRFVSGFGVATECGFGRGPSERTASLLDLHETVAASL
jgi:methionine synthase II (cobalamin-independent)